MSRRMTTRSSGRVSALQDSAAPSGLGRLLPWLIVAILLAAVIVAVLLQR